MLRRLMVAALVFVTPAFAGEFTPNPLTTYVIDLDTPDQHMSAWELGDISSLNALRATVKINGLVAPSGEMKPGFIIKLGNDDESTTIYIAGNPKENRLAVTLSHTVGKSDTKEGGVYLTSLTFEPRQAFDLAIDWTADGKLTATLSGYKGPNPPGNPETKSVQLRAAPKQIAIYSANGEIEINPIKLGRTAP